MECVRHRRVSLSPQNHCFPIAGCVAFAATPVRAPHAVKRRCSSCKAWTCRLAGSRLTDAGLVQRSDPQLDDGLGDERTLATLIFHELAHQRFYCAGRHLEFNESFATFCRAGRHPGNGGRFADAVENDSRLKQRDQFIQLIIDTRADWKSYTPATARRADARAQAAVLNNFVGIIGVVLIASGRVQAYDAWVNAPLNTAAAAVWAV